MSDHHKNIVQILEKHFKDAVDLEFTIQDGKLWVLQARPAKRTGRANLKICTDLFFEKTIDLNEVISRVRFRDFEEVLVPTIQNESDLLIIGQGLPASPGAATGKIYFSSEEMLSTVELNKIFCRIEYSPEDLEAMDIASGIISARGGMTSHASVVSRGMGKPCVSGIGSLNIDYRSRKAEIHGIQLNEGDWITINGSKGNLYKGKGVVLSLDWRNDKELFIIHKIVEKAICTDNLRDDLVGKAWILRDFFLHNIPLWGSYSEKRNVESQDYVSFKHPKKNEIKNIRSKLVKIDSQNKDEKYIIQGFRNSLLRQLANKVGIGNHYKYYRPLIDPMLCVSTQKSYGDEIIYNQLIGEEYFNISQYIPNLIDIYNVKIYIEKQTSKPNGLSFLDYTNPRGESIIMQDENIVSYYIEINEIPINPERIANLYNTFRKREYFWKWYSENITSHREMVNFINLPQKERIKNFRLNTYAHELELLDDNVLTNTGKALIQ